MSWAGSGRSSRLPRMPLRRRTAVLAAATAMVVVAALGYAISTWSDPGGTTGAGAGPGAGDAGKISADTGAQSVTSDRYGAAELRTDKGIPVKYRKLIVDSAHNCAQPEVTPALIAAMLKSESNFDPNLSDPVAGEYGIGHAADPTYGIPSYARNCRDE